MNICGGCTLCCDLIEVRALNKPANTKCSQCVEGIGCTVWQERSLACKRFVCLWYANPKFPEALRPDKCGVVFEPLRGRPVLLALTSPDNSDAWRADLPLALIEKFVADATSVIATDGTIKHFLLPEGVSEANVRAHVHSGVQEMEVRAREAM